MAPSRRCFECKRRKTKCDGTVPGCEKCSSTGKICPGYPDQLELRIRDMTAHAGNSVKFRVQRALESRQQQAEHASKWPSSQVSPSPASSGLSPHFVSVGSWPDEAISTFCADFMVHSNIVPENISCLLELYGTTDADACLKDAFHATAFVSRANQLGLDWMVTEAGTMYGRALASISRVLADSGEAKKDTTLAAIYMLGMYEFISGNNPTGVLMDHHHHQGRMQLLRLRTDGDFSSLKSITRRLYSIISGQAVTKYITRHEMPCAEIKRWMERGGVLQPYQQAAQIHFRTAQLAAEAQVLFDEAHEVKFWETKLREVERADRLDDEYQGWIDKYSQLEPWRFESLPSPSWMAPPGRKEVYIFHDIWVAYIWVGCWSKRAHLQEVRLHCYTLLSSHRGSSQNCSHPDISATNTLSATIAPPAIEDMVFRICCSVPFMLGEIDGLGESIRKKISPLGGYLLVWPLHVAMASTVAGSKTEAWIREKLRFIDRSLGLRLRSLVAVRARKEPWNLR